MNEELLQTKNIFIYFKCRINFYKSQLARALRRESKHKDEIKTLKKECRENKKLINKTLKENNILKAELINVKKLHFGRQSEQAISKPISNDLTSFVENKRNTPDLKQRRRGQLPGKGNGHGRTFRPALPAITEYHDLETTEILCSVCSLPYTKIERTEDSAEIDWEVKIVKKRHCRKCYIRTCSCHGAPLMKVAPKPSKLIPKGLFSISFWTNILLEKYLYQRSLNSLLRILEMRNCPVSSGTITGGLSYIGELLQPVHALILERNRSAVHWFCDETRWKVFVETEGKKGFCWWLWIFISADTCVYVVDPSRSSKVPLLHLGDETEGIISCDRYSAYKYFANSLDNLTLAYCWAHVRRDFIKIGKGYKRLNNWASAWIDMIGDIYNANNKRMLEWLDPDITKNTVQAEKFYNGDKLLRRKISKFKKQVDDELAALPIKKKNEEILYTVRRGVLSSLIKHWSGLTVFVDNPKIPMDNNTAERGIRNPVIGRKNYYGNGAEWSAKLSALLFTIFQTLLRNNINPEKWLLHYFQCCADNKGNSPPNPENFLPWNMSHEQKNSLKFSGTSP